jgi:DNA helicase INO80
VTKPSEIVQLLLNDEQLASFDSAAGLASNTKGKQAGETRDPDSVRDLWNDEGDDFFGHAASLATKADEENGPSATTPAVRGKKRKSTTTGAPRGRPKKKGPGS